MREPITRRAFVKKSAVAGAVLGASAGRVFLVASRALAASVDPAASGKFGASLKGRLVLPGDSEYESARTLWNTRHDKHPAMIARCAATDDVVRCVEFARKNDLVVAIRSGGHDPAGFSSCDGGLVIDLGAMDAIDVDQARGLASVQAGVHVGQLYSALGKHGLVAVSGSCPTVGVGGLTAGGGEGWICSKYGMACDNVLAAEVVTADGRVLRATSNVNPDLFWAIRGGSGNFGVVTRFGLRTIPLARVMKGSIVYPVSRCREVLRFCSEFIAVAPEELTLGISYGVPGPADQIFITICWCGDPAQGERAIKPLRSFAKPVSDDIRVVPADRGLIDSDDSSMPYFESGAFISHLADRDIETLCDAISGAPSRYSLEMFQLGRGVERGDSAFPLRTPGFNIDLVGSWRSAAERDAAAAWVDQRRKALEASSTGVYVNSLGDPGMARAAFGANYDRLVQLKNKYDPTNFFRMNQNIRPTVLGAQ